MKKSLLLISLLLCNSVVLASSNVVFPIKNQEVKPYPDHVSINLNGTDGTPLHNDASYKITCHINNPNAEVVVLQFSQYPATACGIGICGHMLNGVYIDHATLHLIPGVNTFVITGAMPVSYNPNTKMQFKNYDNTLSVVLQDCTAELE